MACPYTEAREEITGVSRLRRPFLYGRPRPPARREYSDLNAGFISAYGLAAREGFVARASSP